MIKISDFVAGFVSKLDIKNVFLLPGGGCIHLVDSLSRQKKIKLVACLHEQAAAIAADAYGQYSGNIGVALVTTGPGGTNAITGAAGSWIDSTPVLVLSGQAKRADLMRGTGVRQMGMQEVDIISMVKPITKYAVTVMEPESMRYHLEKAVYLAKHGRPGPVWIDIPLDVQGACVDEKTLKPFSPADKALCPDISRCVKHAIGLLNKAERPVILAGNGIRLAGTKKNFLKLAQKLKIPVLLTWKAIDFLPEDSPLYFGRPGSIGQRGANFMLQNADCVLAIGARLDPVQIGYSYESFARYARKIIVDIDEAEIRKIKARIDVPVIVDAGDFIRGMLRGIGFLKKTDRSDWLEKCAGWKRKYPVILPEYLKPAGKVNTYALIHYLCELMRSDDVLVPGSSGSCAEITPQAFRVKKGQRILNNPGLGSMGFGLPASIGACLASGKKRTISLIGDGGLQHNIQELETLARLKLPIKLFVLNNNGYASIRMTQERYFSGHLACCDPSSGLTIPDTMRIASAYRIPAMRISNQRSLANDVKAVLASRGPFICEVLVDPVLQTVPRLASEIRSDGTIVSKPLEDLYPFLDRTEFDSNMIAAQPHWRR